MFSYILSADILELCKQAKLTVQLYIQNVSKG